MIASKDRRPWKKVRKIHNWEDRISSLPDSVLVYILSFLPTKHAVGSSILSKRWKHLWASVPTLDLNVTHRCGGSRRDSVDYSRTCRFMNFVDHVLLNHDLPCIKKFNLASDEFTDHARIYTWIGEAIRRGVRELDLRIRSTEPWDCIPAALFTSPALAVLKLEYYRTLSSFNYSVHFKSLKVLHVTLYYPGDDLTKTLFRSCPVLEDLYIKADVGEEMVVFDVSASALESFRVEFSTNDFSFLDTAHEVVVKAPVLRYITLQDDYLPCYQLNNPTSLVEANVNVGSCCMRDLGTKEHANRIFMLLRELSSVQILSLGARTLGAIDYADDGHLPLFPNLTRLELEINGCCSWNRPLDLLNGMPNLVFLRLKRSKLERFSFEHGRRFRGGCDRTHGFAFIEPKTVPSCLSSRLQEIEITGFKGLVCKLKLIGYFRRNAKVLRKMTVNDGVAERKREDNL